MESGDNLGSGSGDNIGKTGSALGSSSQKLEISMVMVKLGVGGFMASQILSFMDR